MKYELKYPVQLPKTVDKPERELKELNLADRMQAVHAEKIPDEAFHGGGVNPTRFLPAIAEMAGERLEDLKRLDYVDVVGIVGAVITPFLLEMSPMTTEEISEK